MNFISGAMAMIQLIKQFLLRDCLVLQIFVLKGNSHALLLYFVSLECTVSYELKYISVYSVKHVFTIK